MSAKKRYKKIIVNGDPIVDFSEQSITAAFVCSGNTFFDEKGELKYGQSVSPNFAQRFFSFAIPDTPNESFLSSTVYFNNLKLDWDLINNSYNTSSQWLEYTNPINEFRFGNNCEILSYSNTLSLSSMSYSKDKIFNFTFDKDNPMLNKDYSNVTLWTPHNRAEELINSLTYACYIENSDFKFPTDIRVATNRGAIGCEFKTTEDGFINYIKTLDNKIYLKNLNIAALDANSTNIYDLTLPDYIEGLPVVHICDRFFESYALNVCRINSIKFPIHLESISIDTLCQQDMPDNIKLPNNLKIIHVPFDGNWDPHVGNMNSNITLPDSFEGFFPICCSTNVISNSRWNSGRPITIHQVEDSALSSTVQYVSTEHNQTAVLLSAEGDGTEFSVAEGCTQVLPEALSYCRCSTVILPVSLKYFSQGGDHNYSGYPDNSYIQEVIFNNSEHEVIFSPRSFNNWTSLNNIILPNNLTFIPDKCFYNCSALNTLTIPANVTYIGKEALKIGSSSNKATITLLCNEPPILPDRSIINTNYLSKIIVPKNTIDKYKQADNWSAFSNYFMEAAE